MLKSTNIYTSILFCPRFRTLSVLIKHTPRRVYAHTYRQLFLSHAPRSFICSFHTAMSQKCKHCAEGGRVVQACKDPGLALGLDGLCAHSPSHPLGGKEASKMLRISWDQRGEERRADGLYCGKNPRAVYDPKPPLTSLCFSPRLSLLLTDTDRPLTLLCNQKLFPTCEPRKALYSLSHTHDSKQITFSSTLNI